MSTVVRTVDPCFKHRLVGCSECFADAALVAPREPELVRYHECEVLTYPSSDEWYRADDVDALVAGLRQEFHDAEARMHYWKDRLVHDRVADRDAAEALLVGLRALIAQWRAEAPHADAEGEHFLNQCANELDTLLAASRPRRETP